MGMVKNTKLTTRSAQLTKGLGKTEVKAVEKTKVKAVEKKFLANEKEAKTGNGQSVKPIDKDSAEVNVLNHHAKRNGKSMEEIYQKKTQLEHILLRPDAYIGSCESQVEEKWVYTEETKVSPAQMTLREVEYVPGLCKIFDEILVNAADNLVRHPDTMNSIEVTINVKKKMISVYNNGRGLPVYVHKEHKMYIPEMLFGHLLTSDNYDDDEKKVVGGRNGFGAKLTNIFSTKFKLETVDEERKKYYCQEFTKNMSVINKPTIEDSSEAPYTRVTFWPDLSKFGMEELTSDTVAMMAKRVIDIAGSTNSACNVLLNGKRLRVNKFLDYVKTYLTDEDQKPVHEICSDRWEIAFAVSPQEQFQQVSFVNSICTTKGGAHVTHVTDQLVETILKKVRAKNKGGMVIRPAHIRSHLWVFVRCLIENPAFDSQTKDTLTTKMSSFGSKCEISEAFVNKVAKSGVIEQIIMWAKAKEKISLKKMKGFGNVRRLTGISKLDDANDAGTKNGHLCTLILTEGDSAKSLAIAGLSVIGRDRYGVFPLRGKVLNVRDASYKMVMGNVEIQAILKILGLQPEKQYSSLQQLRYGSIMIMADQDYDGSHIKGLLINFFDHWWPNLLREHPGFLKEFITPIVKATPKVGTKATTTFYTIPEYENWKRSHDLKSFDIKYYKGLGTSTVKEAKEYFANLTRHQVEFTYDKKTTESIDLAFNKKRTDDRKTWINAVSEGTFVDTSSQKLKYTDFINKELVLFSKYNLQRAIPSVVDGFKTTQRKIMYCAFKRKMKKDIKVAQFVGYIGEHASYHHGEQSLANTIVNMAQTFVGANNVNLLFPSGQFGTRMQAGSDAAASRYIFTRLCDYTRLIFNPLDDHILTYGNDDGQCIEPEWYCPIIPMVLVNGGEGIGTGWSTSIPNYNPMDIISNCRRAIRHRPMTKLVPWFKNFVGEITPGSEPGKYDCVGCIEKRSDTAIEITELPVKRWTTEYKENVIEPMLPNFLKRDDKGNVIPRDPLIQDYRDYSTESKVHFALKLSEENMARAEIGGLAKTFKLKNSISENNMVLFDADGKIRKYDSANEIIVDFLELRLKMYHKRKEFQVDQLGRSVFLLNERVRFILLVINSKLEIRNVKKADMISQIKKLKFKTWAEIHSNGIGSTMAESHVKSDDISDEEDDTSKKESKGDYDYLLGMPLWNLTREKVKEMQKVLGEKQSELDTLMQITVEEMWDRDLVELQNALSKAWEIETNDAKVGIEAGSKKRTLKETESDSDEDAKGDKQFFRPTSSTVQPQPAWEEFDTLDKSRSEPAPKKARISDKRMKNSTQAVESDGDATKGTLLDRLLKRQQARLSAIFGGETSDGNPTTKEPRNEACNGKQDSSGPSRKTKDPPSGSNGKTKDPPSGSNGKTKDSPSGSNGKTKDSPSGSNGKTKDPPSGSNGKTKDPPSGSNGKTKDSPSGSNGKTKDSPSGSNGKTKDPPSGSNGKTKDSPSGSNGKTKDPPSCSNGKTKDPPSGSKKTKDPALLLRSSVKPCAKSSKNTKSSDDTDIESESSRKDKTRKAKGKCKVKARGKPHRKYR